MRPEEMHMKRVWIGLGIVGVLVVGVVLYRVLRPVEVQVTQVERGTAEQRVYGSARVEARKRAAIKSRVSGTIKAVHVEPGQSVQAGQLLLTIDTPQIKQDVSRAQADLYAAQQRFREQPLLASLKSAAASIAANLDQAKADLTRAEMLTKNGAAATAELERAKTQVRVLEGQLQSNRQQQRDSEIALQAELSKQRASVGSLQSRVEDMEVRSPIAGTLLWQGPKLGDVVLTGQELARVGDTGHLWIESLVDEADIPSVRVGQTAWIRLNGSADRMLQTTVARIIPEVQTETKSVEVDLDFTDAKTLADLGMVPGMTGEAYIVTQQKENVLLVPGYAVDLKSVWVDVGGTLQKQLRGGVATPQANMHFGLWIVENGRLHERPVKIGVRGSAFFEVVSGLASDARVVLPREGVPLKEGAAVRTVLVSNPVGRN